MTGEDRQTNEKDNNIHTVMGDAVTNVLISWEEICKVTSRSKVSIFEKKMTEVQTYVVLTYGFEFNRHDYFIHCCSLKYSYIKKEMVNDTVLQNKINQLGVLLKDIMDDFEKQTSIPVVMELNSEALKYNYYDEGVIFTMDFHRTVQLTPKASELQKKGIKFYMNSWAITK